MTSGSNFDFMSNYHPPSTSLVSFPVDFTKITGASRTDYFLTASSKNALYEASMTTPTALRCTPPRRWDAPFAAEADAITAAEYIDRAVGGSGGARREAKLYVQTVRVPLFHTPASAVT